MIEITDIKISLRRNPKKLKAYATIILNNCFVVRGLKVVEGNRRVFIAMPSRRAPDGQFHDIAHPISRDMRNQMEELILRAYFEEVERNKEVPEPTKV